MSIWTDTNVDLMVGLSRRGVTAKEIGKQLGIAAKTVINKRTRMRAAGDSRIATRPSDRVVVSAAGRVSRPLTPPPAPIAARDPCWRCGVRGDVGCIHQPLEIAS